MDSDPLIKAQYQGLENVFLAFNEDILKGFIRRNEESLNSKDYHMKIDNTLGYGLVMLLKKRNQDDDTEKQQLLKFGQCCLRILKEKNLITERVTRSIEAVLSIIKADSTLVLQKVIAYLAQADNQQDFRYDFADRLLNKKQEELDDSNMASLYHQFWTKKLQVKKKTERCLLVRIYSLICRFEPEFSSIVGENLANKIKDYIGNDFGTTEKQVEINKKLNKHANILALNKNSEEYKNLEKIQKLVENLIREFSQIEKVKSQIPNMGLAIYGSSTSGFASYTSDLDLTILTNCFVEEKILLKALNEYVSYSLTRLQQASGMEIKVVSVQNARIPVISILFSSQDLKKSIEVDVTVNNILGIINSKFQSVYASVLWVKQLGLLVKDWAKKNSLVQPNELSSYAFILLMLHYLIDTGEVNLILDARRPNHNNKFNYKRRIKLQDQKFEVQYKFLTDTSQIPKKDQNSLFELLRGFFQYYGTKGSFWMRPLQEQVITVDGKNPARKEKYAFTIKDPFDKTHNPGRAPETSKLHLLKCFDEAYKILDLKGAQSVDTIMKRLFEKVND